MFCHSCKALPSLSITPYASLRVAEGCLARTVCRGRTLHAAARVAPGGLAVPIHLDRTLNPPQMVAVRRLPMAIGLLGHLDTPGAVSKRRLAVPVRRVRSLNPSERITPGGRAGAIRRHRPLQPPGGVPVCCLSTWVASHRTLYPSLSVPISRLPESVRFIRPGYSALPVTIDRLPGSIRVNRPLSATRCIIICRRRSQSLHLRLHRVLESNHPVERSWPTGKDCPRIFTNRHASPFVKIRVNSWTGQERLRLLQDLRACGRDKRVPPAFSQDRKDAPFLSCSSTPLHLYGHSHSPLLQGTAVRNRPTNYDVSPFAWKTVFSCCPRKNPSWRTSWLVVWRGRRRFCREGKRRARSRPFRMYGGIMVYFMPSGGEKSVCRCVQRIDGISET